MVSKYTSEYAKNIFNGEIGKYYNVRFVEETGFLSNSIGSGSTHGQAVFFGADNVYEAVAVPEEIRVKVSLASGKHVHNPYFSWARNRRQIAKRSAFRYHSSRARLAQR